MNDTIAAISTSLGVGAISIIRISGEDSINICNKIFKGKDLNKVESHTINYGKIVDNDEIVDEVLVSIMKAPKTFTREDVIEINCHGGIATTQKILELLLRNGARLAEPGEFTKRAFLNGRIDLLEAESIMDLINSKTEKARKLAINGLNGNLSKLIKDLRQKILELLANIEVNIDYPEYEDIEIVTNTQIKNNIEIIKKEISNIIEESKNGKIIKEGIKTSIIGRPNVGKSSLLNLLLGEEKAIVTDIEGTTRDIVEGTINIDGVLLNILDTAGIRKTDNIVEEIGVNKSISLIDDSQLVLYVLNNNELIKEEEINLLNKIYEKNHILIINKIDLESKINKEILKTDNIIYISTKTKEGLKELKNKIKEIFNLGVIEKDDLTYLTNSRDIAILEGIKISINDVEEALENNLPVDMIEIDLKKIWEDLGLITGETYNDELINQLFSQFCLGK